MLSEALDRSSAVGDHVLRGFTLPAALDARAESDVAITEARWL